MGFLREVLQNITGFNSERRGFLGVLSLQRLCKDAVGSYMGILMGCYRENVRIAGVSAAKDCVVTHPLLLLHLPSVKPFDNTRL